VLRLLLVAALGLSASVAAADSLSLSPAAVPLRGRPGQSTTQTLTLTNQMPLDLAFRLAAKDVVVTDGKRRFVDPVELPDSIAASAVFSARDVVVPAGARRSVDVTITLVPGASHRAVVVLFEGTTPVEQKGRWTRLSLGTLLTFTISDAVALEASALSLEAPTAASPLGLEMSLRNVGQEPAVARGVAVILADGGRIVGRTPIDARRLLPGETARLRADYGGELPSGRYQVLATLDYEGRALSRTADLVIQ
jgi:hypothetical protein